MAIKGFARLRVPAAVAKPSPAIGQALGPLGVNMMEFCRQFNARTTIFKEEVPLRVKVIAKEDRTFDFNISAPPTTWFLKQASGITKGAQQPGIEKAGEVSIRALFEIAQIKKEHDENLSTMDLQGIVKSLMGSAKSMGLEVTK